MESVLSPREQREKRDAAGTVLFLLLLEQRIKPKIVDQSSVEEVA